MTKKCLFCGIELRAWRRRDLKYCSAYCKHKAFLQRKALYGDIHNTRDVSKRISQLPSWMRPAEKNEEVKNENIR